MDKKFSGRYFVIDTNPSTSNLPSNLEEVKEYESDHIDEEIEHRLYSMIHHSCDVKGELLSTQCAGSSPDSVEIIEPNESLNINTTCSATTSDDKKRKKNHQDSLTKKVKQASPIASTSSIQETPVHHNATIYLSDSDEDTNDDMDEFGNKRDLWHIDHKDILINNPIHGKFYRPRIWCSRCRKEGNHPVKLCHLPKNKICYICGSIGHLGQHCKNQHCKRCMDFHPTSKCSLNVRDFQCRICCKFGHLDDNCPNHWRKFHNITDPQIDPDVVNEKILKNKKKSCSNCGRHQHYSFECDKLRQRPIEVSSPYDVNTAFGGNFHPHRHKTQKLHQSPESSSSSRKFRRSSRYFSADNHDSMQPYRNSQEIVAKNSNKNKTKSGKKNKKKKKAGQNQDIEIIKGPAVRDGRVQKNKSKQLLRRKQQRKAGKKIKSPHFGTMSLGNNNFMTGYRY